MPTEAQFPSQPSQDSLSPVLMLKTLVRDLEAASITSSLCSAHPAVSWGSPPISLIFS